MAELPKETELTKIVISNNSKRKENNRAKLSEQTIYTKQRKINKAKTSQTKNCS